MIDVKLKPFFCYYGGKYRAAPHYPKPEHSTIVEPFAGAAGYSTRYPDRNVFLVDLNPVLVGVWDYLIRAPESEILSIPDVHEHVDELNGPPEQKWLVGFWLNKGTAMPCKRPSAWMRSGIRPHSFWGNTIRERIASQQRYIRHWQIHHASYVDACFPVDPCTWFVDPPYQKAGKHYKNGTKDIDYVQLGKWCRTRNGQIIVCENVGADWLPFQSFLSIKATPGASREGSSVEVLWTTSSTSAT